MSYITFSLISLFLGPANPSITSVDFALSLTKSFLTVFCIGLSFSSNLDPLEIFLELKKKRKARGNKGVTSLFFKLLKDGENQEKGSAEDHVRLRILVGRFGFHPTGQCKSEGQQSDTAHEHRNDQGDLPSVRQNGSDARGKPRGGKG